MELRSKRVRTQLLLEAGSRKSKPGKMTMDPGVLGWSYGMEKSSQPQRWKPRTIKPGNREGEARKIGPCLHQSLASVSLCLHLVYPYSQPDGGSVLRKWMGRIILDKLDGAHASGLGGSVGI